MSDVYNWNILNMEIKSKRKLCFIMYFIKAFV